MRRVLVLSVCLALASACGSPKGTYTTPSEMAASARQAGVSQRDNPFGAERSTSAASGAAPSHAESLTASALDDVRSTSTPRRADGQAQPVAATTDAYQKRKREFDGLRRKLDRRAEDLGHQRATKAEEWNRLAIEHESQRADEQLDLRQAQHAQATAGQDLDRFRGSVRQRRVAEDSLKLQRAADNLLEVREELAQLELMYDGQDLGDATAEIVVSRTRRRLQRSEEQHRIASEKSAELREVLLPREEQDLELAVLAAMVSLENAQRSAQAGEIRRTAALGELEQQARGHDREDADIQRELQELDQDLRRWEATLSMGAMESLGGGARDPARRA